MREGKNPQRPEVISIGIGDSTIEVEIAGEGAGLNLGLMFREELGADEGMWFTFPEEDFRRFWMKNTKIPLSIAFVDGGGRIGNIEDLDPYDESQVFSKYKAKYAWEMNRGWFERNGVEPGMAIRLGRKKPNPQSTPG